MAKVLFISSKFVHYFLLYKIKAFVHGLSYFVTPYLIIILTKLGYIVEVLRIQNIIVYDIDRMFQLCLAIKFK